MREITAAVANKILKGYNEEIDHLYAMEANQMTYVEFEGSDPVKPNYDFHDIRARIEMLEQKVLDLKHTINLFNSRVELPELNITIDQALVRIAQLTKQKQRLEAMRRIQPKAVNNNYTGRSSGKVEYTVANFNPDDVNTRYEEITLQLNRLQWALDRVNSTEPLFAEVE